MKRWYFAYGSNLLKEQMTNRTGGIEEEHPPRLARLIGFQLGFERLERDGPAFANLRPGAGIVFGALYHCSSDALKRLDGFEKGYERRMVQVTDSFGETLAATAYFIPERAKEFPGQPSDEYLARIVNGAKEHRLPETYIETIVAQARSERVER